MSLWYRRGRFLVCLICMVCRSQYLPKAKINDELDAELASLMVSVQRVGNVIERAFGADALTVACQVNTLYLTISTFNHRLDSHRTELLLVNRCLTFTFTSCPENLSEIIFQTTTRYILPLRTQKARSICICNKLQGRL